METLQQTPQLDTGRLTLRPLRKSDAGLISLYTGDFRVAGMLSTVPHPNPPGAVEAFMRKVMTGDNGDLNWAIDATKGYGCSLVGGAGLDRDGEIGFWLGPFFWGLGIGTEAVGAMCAFARRRDYPRLHASVFQDNPASRRVLEKNGFNVDRDGDGFSVARNSAVRTWEMVDGAP